MGIKTTLIINEKVWANFKKFVSTRHGSLRKLSSAVEEAIKTFNTAELLINLSNTLDLNISVYPSATEIKSRRPKLSTSAGEIVREMRDERETRLLGLKQHS